MDKRQQNLKTKCSFPQQSVTDSALRVSILASSHFRSAEIAIGILPLSIYQHTLVNKILHSFINEKITLEFVV